jgi:tRNA U55 pseudouridine synthase TruB
MTSLERTSIGAFSVGAALAPELLSADSVGAALTNPLQIVSGMPTYQCGDGDEELVRSGRQLTVGDTNLHIPEDSDAARVSEVAIVAADGTRLLALGELSSQNDLVQPRTVFIR